MKKSTQEIIKVNQVQLLAMLQTKDAIKGGTFIGLITDTEETNIIKPKTCGLAGLRKITLTVGHIYSHAQYANQMKKINPEYIPQPRKWGVRMEDFPLVLHKDKYYLEVFFDNDRVKTRVIGYYLNGEEIPKEVVRQHLRPKEDEPITYRNYSIDSILQMSFKKKKMIIEK